MNKMEEMTDKLTKLRENAPSIKTKGKPVYDYFYRERYLDKEVFFNSFFVKLASILAREVHHVCQRSSRETFCSFAKRSRKYQPTKFTLCSKWMHKRWHR